MQKVGWIIAAMLSGIIVGIAATVEAIPASPRSICIEAQARGYTLEQCSFLGAP